MPSPDPADRGRTSAAPPPSPPPSRTATRRSPGPRSGAVRWGAPARTVPTSGFALADAGAVPSGAVTTEAPPELELAPVGGEARALSEWVTNFHLVLVVVDPYTNESAWLLET